METFFIHCSAVYIATVDLIVELSVEIAVLILSIVILKISCASSSSSVSGKVIAALCEFCNIGIILFFFFN